MIALDGTDPLPAGVREPTRPGLASTDGRAPGTGLLEIVRTGDGSVVSRAYATSPLRLLTPRAHRPSAWIYTSSYGGGLVGGDALRLSIDVGRGARAFVSSQSSSKIYRSERGSSLTVDARVGAGAHLVMWPDPVVCFAKSAYRQHQRFDVDRDGVLVLVDWMTSGRRASGERWQFSRYESGTIVRLAGQLVVRDSVALCAADGELARRMGRFDVLCTVAVVGGELREHIDTILAAAAAVPLQRRSDVLIAAAPIREPASRDPANRELTPAGCLLRIAGPSVERVAAVLHPHLSFVPCLLGDDPWARKW